MSHHAQLEPHGLFDARVPRYTSYPAATRFSARVGGDDLIRWLAAVPAGRDISLYLHVPFCRRLCWFCACRTQGTRTLEPLTAYLETLKAEIDMIAAALPAGTRLSRLHWGGGTPTLMSPAMIGDLARAVKARLPMAEEAEFSVEIDPNEAGGGRLEALARAGMTRASIGVQDFDPEIQNAIGRQQGFDLTAGVVAELRELGIRSLNTDILFGLPHQTTARITDSVEKVLSLAPDRVALYGYAHVPWMSKRQVMIPAEALPPPEARLDLFETARALFLAAGYNQVGIDHFARPGDGLDRAHAKRRLRRNFQGYTDDSADILVGLGASAISRFAQGYAQNAPGTAAYQSAIRDGRPATQRGYALAAEDRLRGAMIEELMCYFEIDIARTAARVGTSHQAVAGRLKGLDTAFPGLLTLDDTALRLTPEARPLARLVAHRLDQHSQSQTAHSPAF